MRANGRGVIVNLITESVRDESSAAAFVASMSGLRGFTQQAARELSPYGVRVYAVESDREQIVERVFALLEQEER
jgi:NAD(P)-dependent dehydrogenase (short-subunit alcohol dehydrogenase family)